MLKVKETESYLVYIVTILIGDHIFPQTSMGDLNPESLSDQNVKNLSE